MKRSDRTSGVLLDVVGTLADSNDAHARMWERAFRELDPEALATDLDNVLPA